MAKMINSPGLIIEGSDDPTHISCQVKIGGDQVVEIRFGGRVSKLRLSEKQRNLLRRINDTLWTEPIDQMEWMTASLGMVEDHDLVLQQLNWQTRCPYAEMPFVVPEGDERTLLRMEGNIWIHLDWSEPVDSTKGSVPGGRGGYLGTRFLLSPASALEF